MAQPWSAEELSDAEKLARTGRISARDIRLTGEQLDRLITLLPRDGDGDPQAIHVDLAGSIVEGECSFGFVRFDAASFDGAVFTGPADFEFARFRLGSFVGACFGDSTAFSNATFVTAKFERARFEADASFRRVECARRAEFPRARFAEPADFCEAQLGDGLFRLAAFGGAARFARAEFRTADFTSATFASGASFDRADFAGEALYAGVCVAGDADFAHATFGGFARLPDAAFAGDVRFDFAVFDDYLDLAYATIDGDLSFRRARFREARGIGPMLVGRLLSLRGSSFDQQVRFEVSARRIDCTDVMFRAGVDLFARWAELRIEGADFAGPSLVAALPASRTLNDAEPFLGSERPAIGGGWERVRAPTGFEPSLLTLRGAKVARLTLSRIDARDCRFAGSHGLDELRLERVTFGTPPAALARGERSWRRWTVRRTIAEEHDLRAAKGHDDWRRGTVLSVDASAALDPAEVASIYRALRRGRERERDEQGAGDFYYGEMEMRRMRARDDGRPGAGRLARHGARAERAILWLYWLVSGYGLRASRALAALALTLAVLAVPLDLWGFTPDRSYGRALLFSAESSISLFRTPEATLTAGGQVVQIILRLSGPLFFGLAMLALRSRVKR